MAFYFTNDLKTGNAQIDKEHEQLINALNELLKACAGGKAATAEVMKTIKFLGDYTHKHFSNEEVLQNKSKYPDYENHKKYHAFFKGKIKEMEQKIRTEGVTPQITRELNSALGDWFINHIKNEDKKVAMHIKSVEGK